MLGKDHGNLAGRLSVDETVIGFSGTSSLVNYNPSKLHKWRITVWSLADLTSCYVYNYGIYTRKKSVPDQCRAVHWTVWDLLESVNVLGKGHHVHKDNYFSSPNLFSDLPTEGTGVCGTLCTNRKGTPDIIK